MYRENVAPELSSADPLSLTNDSVLLVFAPEFPSVGVFVELEDSGARVGANDKAAVGVSVGAGIGAIVGLIDGESVSKASNEG